MRQAQRRVDAEDPGCTWDRADLVIQPEVGFAPRVSIIITEQEAFRRLRQLNGLLLRYPSATVTLERWIDATWPQRAGHITVDRLACDRASVDHTHRARLQAEPDEPICHRRVRLRRGDTVLSEADNWYRPRRLTPEMNETLNTTDTSFGRVVQSLNFSRVTASTELLWQPSRVGTGNAVNALILPNFVMRHQALLTLMDGTPFSEVLEVYTKNVLVLE